MIKIETRFVKQDYNIAMLDHTINKQCCFSNSHKTMHNSVSDCFSLMNFKNQCWLVIKKLFVSSTLHLTCSDDLFSGSIFYGKTVKLFHIKELTTNI